MITATDCYYQDGHQEVIQIGQYLPGGQYLPAYWKFFTTTISPGERNFSAIIQGTRPFGKIRVEVTNNGDNDLALAIFPATTRPETPRGLGSVYLVIPPGKSTKSDLLLIETKEYRLNILCRNMTLNCNATVNLVGEIQSLTPSAYFGPLFPSAYPYLRDVVWFTP